MEILLFFQRLHQQVVEKVKMLQTQHQQILEVQGVEVHLTEQEQLEQQDQEILHQ
jgi:hypothetical protein